MGAEMGVDVGLLAMSGGMAGVVEVDVGGVDGAEGPELVGVWLVVHNDENEEVIIIMN